MTLTTLADGRVLVEKYVPVGMSRAVDAHGLIC